MSGASGGAPHGTVLVVDDEPGIVETYAAMLEDQHSVRSATSGPAALERLDEDVDVVLLDRRMPDLSGDEVLERIRAEGYDCRVAMVSAVDPGVDIAEMDVDAYLVKPARRAELRTLVRDLLLRSAYDSDLQELWAVTSKLVALEGSLEADELDDEECRELRARQRRLRAETRDQVEELAERTAPGTVFTDALAEESDS